MTVALGLFAAVGWAFVTLRLASVSRGLDPAVGMLVLLASSLVLTAPLGLALDGLPPADGRGLGAAAVAGLLEMTGFLCYLKAVQRGSMAVIAPLIGLEGGVAAVIAVIGGEAVSATLAVGIVMAALGASLACAAPGERTATGAGWALLAGLQFGVMLTLFGATDELGAFNAVTVARLTALAVLLPVLAVRGWQPTPRPVLRRIAECGLVDAISFGAFAVAATRGPVSVASVCAAQFSTVAVIVAIVVLRERPAPVQLVGIGLTLVGTTVLASV